MIFFKIMNLFSWTLRIIVEKNFHQKFKNLKNGGAKLFHFEICYSSLNLLSNDRWMEKNWIAIFEKFENFLQFFLEKFWISWKMTKIMEHFILSKNRTSNKLSWQTCQILEISEYSTNCILSDCKRGRYIQMSKCLWTTYCQRTLI